MQENGFYGRNIQKSEVEITKEMLKGIEEYTQVGFKVGDTTTIKPGK